MLPESFDDAGLRFQRRRAGRSIEIGRENGAIVAKCEPGTAPAGIELRDQRSLSTLPGLSLRFVHDGGGWIVGMSDAERWREDPLLIGRLSETGPVTSLPIPNGDWTDTGFSATLLCPKSGGRLVPSRFTLARSSAAVGGGAGGNLVVAPRGLAREQGGSVGTVGRAYRLHHGSG